MTEEAGVATVLEERPDLEAPLSEILAVDERRETWDFEDVPVESGPFGELVGRGIVESAGDEYRLADPEAVRATLEGDPAVDATDEDSGGPALPSVGLPAVDRTTALLVAGVITFVALVRVHPIGAIYRDGDVVLSGNDPYHYRYWVEQTLAEGGVPVDVHAGEPLLIAILAATSDVLGGTAAAAGHVMAWYPVVAAVIGAGLVYLLAVTVTEDRRVGLAAVVLLALVPGHAMRTSLGFADHHALDYVWLGVTALAVTKLATVDRERLTEGPTWGLVLLAGVAIAGQVLSWNAGPLVLVPLPAIVAARAAVDLHRGRSPLAAGIPPVVALVVGSVVAVGVHALTGFQGFVVVISPAVLAAGAGGTLLLAVAVHRLGWGVRRLLVGDAVAGIVGLALVGVVVPSVWETFVSRLGSLFGSGTVAEAQGLFDPGSFGFLFLFGLTLLLAVPAMVVGLRRSITDGRWLVLSAYGWYLLVLATVQLRFVGELATFAAVFAGYGFVWAAAWIDAIPRADGAQDALAPLRVPNRRVIATLFVLLLLFGGFGALQSGVKTSQVVIEDDTYRSASAIADHVDERGQEYPENYVLSSWGRNRVYNYFVNGESDTYGYAESTFDEFLAGTDPDSWYNDFQGRVGYVVVPTDTESAPRESTLWQLGRNYGSADGDVAGVGHFRALYEPPGGSEIVYEVVPGAVLNGTTAGNATVTVSTTLDLGEENVTYERRTTAHQSGAWNVRVATPGTYEVETGGTTTTAVVPAEAVYGDERVPAD